MTNDIHSLLKSFSRDTKHFKDEMLTKTGQKYMQSNASNSRMTSDIQDMNLEIPIPIRPGSRFTNTEKSEQQSLTRDGSRHGSRKMDAPIKIKVNGSSILRKKGEISSSQIGLLGNSDHKPSIGPIKAGKLILKRSDIKMKEEY